MLDSETLQKIQKTSIEEKIKTIEIILDSLKNDLQSTSTSYAHQSFKVCEYSLGSDISINRSAIYNERNQ